MSYSCTKKLNVAIIGAGLVGTSAAIALSKLPNVEVTVYEKSTGPQEVGEWIGLTESGMEVLDKLIDISDVNRILYRGDHNASYISRHYFTGEIMGSAESSEGIRHDLRQGRTTRVPLHNVLLKNVPSKNIKYGYYLSNIEFHPDHAKVLFENGDEVCADLVVAADGIYSRIRRKIYPESTLSYKGSVCYRAAFPESIIRDIEGLPDDTSCWHGEKGIFFASRLGNGLYGVVAGIPESSELAAQLKWKETISETVFGRISDHFKGWNAIVRELLKRVPNFKSYPLEHAPWLKTLIYKDRLAFAGDAAHPTSGAYGSGACFGFNDVWVLYQALLHSSHSLNQESSLITLEYDLPKALRIFDETRAPFLSRVERQIALDQELSKAAWKAADYAELVERFKEHGFFIQHWWMRQNHSSADMQKVMLKYSTAHLDETVSDSKRTVADNNE